LPTVVVLAAAPDNFADTLSIELDDLATVAADCTTADGRYVVLSDPTGPLRVWQAGDRPNHKVAILIPLDPDVPLHLDAARRFFRRLRGRPAGPEPKRWQLTALQRARLVLMLRALDARQDGASYRTIAVALFDPSLAMLPARDWKCCSWRAKTMRLVQDAVALMNGGYRRLLHGD
jgi:hypothetical protein